MSSLTSSNNLPFPMDHIRPFNGASNHIATFGQDESDTSEDDVNLEALITDLHSSFPSEQQPLLQSETSSLASEHEYSEIKPYEYTIHDLRRRNTEAQKRNMMLPVQQVTNNSALPNPFPELEKSAINHMPSEVTILQGSRTTPSSPAVQVRVKRRPYTPPLLRHKYNDSKMASDQWGSQLIVKAGERKVSESKRRICVNFYNDESSSDSYKTLVINENLTASDISHLLILKNGAVHDKNWVIVERLQSVNAERSLEDHELVLGTFDTWGQKTENKFVFRKDFKKYDLFQNPLLYFPTQMTSAKEDGAILTDKVERQRTILLQNLILSTDRLPDLHGYLHMKEAGKKSWKKAFFVLRGSGLYYSSKGTSKDPKHLVTFCQFLNINVYTVNNAKKTFHSPSGFAFCFKPENATNVEAKELKCLCAEDEKNRMCWIAGIRLAKYGKQLQENYRNSLHRQEKLHNGSNGLSTQNPDGSEPKERVAMDFTGVHGGRVVDDPNEAIGVAIEEGHQWRKKINRPSQASSPGSRTPSGTSSPASGRRMVNSSSLNMMQPWFHHGVSRNDANTLLAKHGLADGVFLIRESRMMNGCYVLSVAHNSRVKHFQISPVNENGNMYYSLDSNTKFTDLIQLVDFYQLNAGGLPVKLTHFVSKLI